MYSALSPTCYIFLDNSPGCTWITVKVAPEQAMKQYGELRQYTKVRANRKLRKNKWGKTVRCRSIYEYEQKKIRMNYSGKYDQSAVAV